MLILILRLKNYIDAQTGHAAPQPCSQLTLLNLVAPTLAITSFPFKFPPNSRVSEHDHSSVIKRNASLCALLLFPFAFLFADTVWLSVVWLIDKRPPSASSYSCDTIKHLPE
jgi:hypothetical protein